MRRHEAGLTGEARAGHTWPGRGSGAGALAVTPDKRRRLTHAALAFLVTRGWTNRPAHFDVVEISADGVWHILNAFCAER